MHAGLPPSLSNYQGSLKRLWRPQPGSAGPSSNALPSALAPAATIFDYDLMLASGETLGASRNADMSSVTASYDADGEGAVQGAVQGAMCRCRCKGVVHVGCMQCRLPRRHEHHLRRGWCVRALHCLSSSFLESAGCRAGCRAGCSDVALAL